MNLLEEIEFDLCGSHRAETFMELPHTLVAHAHVEVRRCKAEVIDGVRVHHQRRFHRGLAGAAAVQDLRAPAEALTLRVVEPDGADWRTLLFDDGCAS